MRGANGLADAIDAQKAANAIHEGSTLYMGEVIAQNHSGTLYSAIPKQIVQNARVKKGDTLYVFFDGALGAKIAIPESCLTDEIAEQIPEGVLDG